MKTLTILALLLTATSAHAQTHEADFPDEMRAINQCYVAIIGGKLPHSDNSLRTCIEGKGFKFCETCRIFHTKGMLCKDDLENGIHRATCWRSKESILQ